MIHLPLDIINELQFYIDNDKDVDKLDELSNNEMIRYYHNTINKDIGDKRKDRILKLIIRKDDIVNLLDFKNLIYLNCHNNKLTTLPTLPSGLTRLDCSWNRLTTLPTLPSSLKELDCSFNKLTILPTLPPTLKELDCCGNKLTTLGMLPSGLEKLYCGFNSIPDEIISDIKNTHPKLDILQFN